MYFLTVWIALLMLNSLDDRYSQAAVDAARDQTDYVQQGHRPVDFDSIRSAAPRVSGDQVQLYRSYKKQKKKAADQSGLWVRSQVDRLVRLNEEHSRNGTRFENRTLPFPHQHLSFSDFVNESVIPLTDSEMAGRSKCSFAGASCAMERIEHSLVQRYIRRNDSVLELGARYGTTSCAIAHQLNNSGRLISVEPDHRVWNILDQNSIDHRCSFWLLRGTISDKPLLDVTADSLYNTRSMASPLLPSPLSKSGSKRSYTMEEIQQVTNLSVSAVLIDCEGCIDSLFAGNSLPFGALLANISTIILEADMSTAALDCKSRCVDYNEWIDNFAAVGLSVVHKEQDSMYRQIWHYVFSRNSPYASSV